MKDTGEKRPPVWIGHVTMHTERVTESSEFMQLIAHAPGFQC